MKILFIIHLNILWLILNLERDFTNYGELLQNLACQLFLFYFILWVGFAFRFLTILFWNLHMIHVIIVDSLIYSIKSIAGLLFFKHWMVYIFQTTVNSMIKFLVPSYISD